MPRNRLNWSLVVPLTILGIAFASLGIGLGRGTAQTWSSVLIEVGVTLGLLSSLVVLEGRVVRQVAESTARVETQRVTTDLRERIQRLEDVDGAQEREYAEQRRLAAVSSQAIRDGDITIANVGRLLVQATRDRLFDRDQFHVRTSANHACPVLYMLPLIDGADNVIAVWLDFQPFRLADPIRVGDSEAIPVPVRTESTVMWMDEAVETIGADLAAGLERRNEPARGFGMGSALEMLLRSGDVMREARAAPDGDPKRLEGELRVLVNDEWAYTSAGLEAVRETTVFPIREGGFVPSRRSGIGTWAHMEVLVPEDVWLRRDEALEEALTWLSEREGVRTGTV